MKRLTYLSGYLFSLIWIAGAMFKMLHLPGAAMMLAIGSIGLALIFFPLLVANRYKSVTREVLSERLKWFMGGVSLLLLVIAISMELTHMMGAGLLMAISFFFIGFGFLPFYFFRMYRKSLDV